MGTEAGRVTRGRLFAATVLVLAVSTGCGILDAPPGPEVPPGCGECTSELEQLRAEVEALPGVGRLATLEKYDASPTNGATVDLEIYSASLGDTGLADEVARIVWQSDLAPVEVVTVSIEDASGDLVSSLPYDFRVDSRAHPTYEEQWGPRPVEE